MSLLGMLPSIELLESRIAPAGVITLEAKAFSYVLSGDIDANELLITQEGSKITLTPQGGTELRHTHTGQTVQSTDPVTIQWKGESLTIEMKDGADVLSLQGLTLPSALVIDMGTGTDSLTITDDLKVGGSLSITIKGGTAAITADDLHVSDSVNIVSYAQTFTMNAGSFYVGEDLSVQAEIRNDADRFALGAVKNFFVYDDFDLNVNVLATNAPPDAISVDVGNTLSVGGHLQVVTNGTGKGAVEMNSDTMILSERVIVKNDSGVANKELSFRLGASAIRMDGGLSITSKSSAPTTVSIESGILIIDGLVSAKLPKSAGELRMVADTLQIGGNVNFASKGAGTLRIEGGGDIYGNVTASLGSGTGDVALLGVGDRPLILGALKVSAPGKNVPAAGINIALSDVSLFGKTSLLLGRGADAININDALFRSAVTISTGDGADTVDIHTEGNSTSVFRKGLGISLGRGNDALTLGRAEAYIVPTALLIHSPQRFDGGADMDTYLASGRNVKFYRSFPSIVEVTPGVRAFESFAER